MDLEQCLIPCFYRRALNTLDVQSDDLESCVSLVHACWAVTLYLYTGKNEVTYHCVDCVRDDGPEGLLAGQIDRFSRKVNVDGHSSIFQVVSRIEESIVQDGYVSGSKALPLTLESTTILQLKDHCSSVLALEARYNKHQCLSGLVEDYSLVSNLSEPVLVICLSSSIVVFVGCTSPQTLNQQWTELVADTFTSVLTHAANKPRTILDELDFTGSANLRLMNNWARNVSPRIEKCLTEIMTHQAHTAPGAKAVCSWDGEMTYTALYGHAVHLARNLMESGVLVEEPVAFCFSKSQWAIVAMMGILFAGATCFPIDPNAPRQRLQEILERLQVQKMVCDVEQARRHKGRVIRLIVYPQDHPVVMSDTQSAAELPELSSSSAAFIMSTSGSTGAPKVVVQEHGAIYTSAWEVSKAFKMNKDSRTFQFASYVFDVSIGDIFMTLIRGGCICIPSEHDRLNNITGVMNDLNVTHACLTTTTIAEIEPKYIPSLENLFVGGEPLTSSEFFRWKDSVHLHTVYGTTEATVWDTINADVDESDLRNIGLPIGPDVWIVDANDDCKLVPVGVTGEIVVGSPQLARGYYGDAKATATTFVGKLPWLPILNREDSVVFYKTGDLGKFHIDGTITYVGRKSTRVKIRGQRVELSEVEQCIVQCLRSGYHHRVVAELISPRYSGQTALVAFIELAKSSFTTSTEDSQYLPLPSDILGQLTERLRKQLPTYMIPSFYVALSHVPTTSTGKIDRLRLRSLSAEMDWEQLLKSNVGREMKALPSTRIESRLLELFADVLAVRRNSVSTDDTFLRMGGDSIKAMRLVAAGRRIGLGFTVSDVMSNPCLSDLAQVTEEIVKNDMSLVQPFTLLTHTGAVEACERVAALCQVSSDCIEDVFPCTPLQEALLALTVKHAEKNITREVFRLPRYLDDSRFQQAWITSISQISTLRTRIVELEEQGLVQVVISSASQSDVVRGHNLEGYLQGDVGLPMELGSPLFRVAVVNEPARDEMFCVLTLHHAIHDGWSMPLILDHVHKIYHGLKAEIPPPFQAFIKHIALNTDEARSNRFWQSQMRNMGMEVFPSLPHPHYEAHANMTIEHQISSTTWAAQQDFTPSTLIRAAWTVLVSMYTSSDDIVFGATVIGRQNAVLGIERMLGPTIATVPIRVIVDWESSLKYLLEHIQNQATNMVDFEHVGLQRIRRINEETKQACSFQSLLVIQPPEEDIQTVSREAHIFRDRMDDVVGSIALESISIFNPYALMIECQLQRDEGLVTRFNFDTNVLDAEQVHRMALQMEHILCLLGDPVSINKHLKDFDFASERDKSDIWRWNNIVPDICDLSLNQMISFQVQRNASAPAVCSWDGSLNYGELDERATILARHLLSVGVNSESVLPLCFQKSLWASVSMMAVIKIGAAAVTMDVTQPEERLRAIVNQIKPVLILSSPEMNDLVGRIVYRADTSNVVVDQERIDKIHSSGSIRLPIVSPQTTFAIVFTSGSTGVPKGALLTHQNMTSALKHQKRVLGLGSGVRIYDFASYAFDAAWFNLLGSLAMGGCLCIPSEEQRKNDLSGSFERLQASFIFLTTSIVRSLNPHDLPGLQTLVMGGEPIHASDQIKWSAHCDLIIAYGPTECTPFSTLKKYLSEKKAARPNEIGEAVGTTTWLVNPQNPQLLSAVGAVGELWLEGPTVGSGYFEDELKTSERFIENPLWLTQGNMNSMQACVGRHGRLYRTGDLVRYNEDGSLLYVTRRDAQVKIRGQRVELAEIEHHLHHELSSRIPAYVSTAVETIIPDSIRKPVLVALMCVQGYDEQSFDRVKVASQLRCPTFDAYEVLQRKLPSHMIPEAYVPVCNIPMTISMKIDRKQIQKMGAHLDIAQFTMAEASRHSIDALPMNIGGQALQKIWADVLNRQPKNISANTPFVQLGGDSITAMQVVSRCRAQGLGGISVSDILRDQTIDKISKNLRQRSRSSTKCPQEREQQRNGPWQLSAIQKMHFDMHPAGISHFNQTFLLKLQRYVAPEALSNAVKSLVTRHQMLRARFQKNTSDNHWSQYIASSASEAFGFTVHRIDDCEDFLEVIRRFVHRQQRSLNIFRGPLFAASLFEREGQRPILMLTAHHLVVDFMSWRVILYDLEKLMLGEKLSELESLSYQTWCDTQRKHALDLTAEHTMPFELHPTHYQYWDLPVEENTHNDIVTFKHTIDFDTTALLLGQCNLALRTEPLDLLIAGLFYSFRNNFHDREPPAIFIEGHGRRQQMDSDISFDLSETVGWFTSIYPLQVASGECQDLIRAITVTKDRRAQLLHKGQLYFAFRHLNPDGFSAFSFSEPIEISFNYAGSYQQLERKDGLISLDESLEALKIDLDEVSSNARRLAFIEVEVVNSQGKLQISLSCHQRMRYIDAIEKWALCFSQTLRSMATTLENAEKQFTTSDFPLLKLSSYEALSSILDRQLPQRGLDQGNVVDVYPCSSIQSGILLAQQKGTATYATYWVWECNLIKSAEHDRVCTDRLLSAWKRVVCRHSALATIIINHPETGDFIQVVLQDPDINKNVISAASQNPINVLHDLERPTYRPGQPLHSFTVCQNSNGVTACRLDINHALIDALSVQALVSDLSTSYSGLESDEAPSFRELIQWLHRTSSSDRITYWRNYLSGIRPCVLVPKTHPQLDRDGLSVERNYIRIFFDQAGDIDGFCRRRSITRSVFVQLAWAMTLSRYVASDDVCFGYLASGRDIPVDDIEQAVGPFVNMLVSHVSLDSSVDKVLAQVKNDTIAGLAHQHVSLAEIQHELQLYDQQLFNTMISVREIWHFKKLSNSEIRFEDKGGDDPHEFDFSVEAETDGSKTNIQLSYKNRNIKNDVASLVANTFDYAIQYLLNLDRPRDIDEHSRRPNLKLRSWGIGTLELDATVDGMDQDRDTSLAEDFHRRDVGVDQSVLAQYRKERKTDSNAYAYPNLPSSTYQPKADSQCYYNVDNVTFPEGYSPLAVVYTAWAIILAGQTGNSDVIFGSDVAGHLIPVRFSLDWTQDLKSWFSNINQGIIQAIRFARSGFQFTRHGIFQEKEIYEFQTLLALDTQDQSEMDKPSQGFRRCNCGLGYASPESAWPLALTVVLHLCKRRGLGIQYLFDSNVMSQQKVKRMSQQFEHIMKQLCSPRNNNASLSSIHSLSFEDYLGVWKWNAKVPVASNICVHEIILTKAKEQPNVVAVCGWDGKLTYGKLEAYSNLLAYYLIQKFKLTSCDGSAQCIIPLCFEKSIWNSVAIMAVMKAGGASVNLDITQPESRLESIVQQTNSPFIVCSSRNVDLANRLANDSRDTVSVDLQILQSLTQMPSDYCLPWVNPNNLLYVVFTSGSTGTPKGVMITHENFSSAIMHQREALGYNKRKLRVLDYVSYAFDVSWSNILQTLASGNCLCVPNDADRHSNIPQMIQLLEANYAHVTPTVARILPTAELDILEHIVYIGEAVSSSDVRRWSSTDVCITNTYGPAECTPVATIGEVSPFLRSAPGIGKGVGLVPWVIRCDGSDNLAAIGDTGELWLEGPLVGKGYLADTERTAAAFVENPPWLLRGIPGHIRGRRGRLYKTGDLVRCDSDGTLHFVGRKDFQVKVNGQRVELQDVEHHTTQCLLGCGILTVVADAIVPSDKETSILVVFLIIEGTDDSVKENVLRTEMNKRIGGLEDRLSQVVPPYMIPRAFVPLSHLPMTASGKTDRRYLRNIVQSRSLEQLVCSAEYDSSQPMQPGTRMETHLQRLWADVLGMQGSHISVEDNFFRIGGDSIGAMRLLAAARKNNLTLSIADIFENPRLRDLASRVSIAEVGNEGDIEPFSLLTSRTNIQRMRVDAAQACNVAPNEVEDVLPCTALQAGLMALTAKEGGGYVARQAFTLHNEIDLNRFQRAWEEVVANTPILRTRFMQLENGSLVQVVVNEHIKWHYYDTLEDYMREDINQQYHLGTPLLCLGLVSKSRERQRSTFCWTMHHALFDGWSLALIMDRVEQAYYHRSVERVSSFARFIKHITDSNKGPAAKFWQGRLLGSNSTSFPSLPSPTYESKADSIMSRSALHVEWPRGHFTPSTFVEAAWSILQSLYTGSYDITFGTTVAGRQAPIAGLEHVVGPTIATVPVRVLVRGDNSVMQLLSQIQNYTVEMLPFEQIGLSNIRRLGPEIEQACNFQALLVIQPERRGKDSFKTIFEKRVDNLASLPSNFSPYTLLIECQLERDGFQLHMSFDSNVISKPEVERMIRQMEHVVKELCRDQHQEKDMSISSLALLSEQDQQDIQGWNSWNPTEQETCVHEVISERALKMLEAKAVFAWDGELSYGMLVYYADMLAHRLCNTGGIVSNSIVPLCFEKSMWTTVAILGVMKAGAASVLLDTTLPEERLRTIVQQVSPKIILSSYTKSDLASRLVEDAQVIEVSHNSWNFSNARSNIDLPQVYPEDLLYVVFTSGSTGTPKGTLISHRNFAATIKYQQEALGFATSSNVYDFASYAFDVAWSNVLHTLSSGACLCVPSEQERTNDLTASLLRYGTTIVDLTPSVARQLDDEILKKLKTLILSGEAISRDEGRRLASLTNVINTYGPAECTVKSTIYHYTPTLSHSSIIGSGLATNTWLVDPEGNDRLVPIGAVGEIWLDGPLVGLGYLNASQTPAVFLENPSWLPKKQRSKAFRSTRVYKTGDLARYNTDGTLVFIGRKDRQIKINGQRVELREIEYYIRLRMAEESSIEIAVELLDSGPEERQKLVAFIGTGIADSRLQKDRVQGLTEGINEHLENYMPHYMLPRAYVPLRIIPMTASGKTDRNELRKLAKTEQWIYPSTSHGDGDSSKPLQESEIVLYEILADVLNVPRDEVQPSSNFMKLGGDSISAMQVVSRCRAQGISITVSRILRSQHVRYLANLSDKETASSVETFQNEPEGTSWELSPIQKIHFDAHPEGMHHYNQSFLLRLRHQVRRSELEAALNYVVSRHAMLRARLIKAENGQWVQRVIPNDNHAFRLKHRTLEKQIHLGKFAQNEQEKLNISSGPVFSAVIFELPHENQMLLLTAHHLVVDLVSWRIIWKDIDKFIHQKVISNHTSSPSFQTWCKIQQQESESLSPSDVFPIRIERQHPEYWGLSPNDNIFEGEEEFKEHLNPETTSLLLTCANEALNTEPVEILLAMVIYSFHQAFQDRPIPAVFLEGHGRETFGNTTHVDLSDTIGWFTTLLPVQIQEHAVKDPLKTLKLVKDARRSVPGNGVPYFACRRYNKNAAADQWLENHDSVELLFNYTGVFRQLESKDGLFERVADPEMITQLQHVSPKAKRMAFLEVILSVENDEMSISISRHRDMKHRAHTEKWLNIYVEALRSFAKQLSQMEKQFTLHDFPLLKITHDSLSGLFENQLRNMNIAASNVEDVYPCSPIQNGILLSAEKGVASYATDWIWQCRTNGNDSAVSTDRLSDAWREIVKRHPILRTIFISRPETGEFVQVLLKAPNVTIEHLRVVESTTTKSLQDLDKPQFSKPGPAHVFSICESLQDGSLACRLDISHALIDAFSMEVIIRDLSRAHDGDRLTPAPSFRQFIEYLQTSSSSSQRLDYWKRYLFNLQPCHLEVPTSHPSRHAERAYLEIPCQFTDPIYDYCRRHGLTRSVFAQIAWALTLSRLTGKDDVCFGYLASGRDAPIDHVYETAGPFVSMLVSRIDLSGNLEEVMETARDDAISSLERQHTPLADIQRAVNLGGAQSLFNTILSVREIWRFEPSSAEDTLQFEEVGGDDPHEFDFAIGVAIDGPTTTVEVSYRRSFIDATIVQEVTQTLTAAIHFLLRKQDRPGSSRVSDSFFRFDVGADAAPAIAFWESQFADAEFQIFPTRPSPSYRPQVDRAARHEEVVLGRSLDDGNFATSTTLRSALAVLIACHSDHSDVVFGVAEPHLRQSLEEHSPNPEHTSLPSMVPLRVKFGWEQTVEELFRQVQEQADHVQSFQRIGLSRIKLLNENARRACDCQVLLVVHPLSAADDKAVHSNFPQHGLIIHYRPTAQSVGIHVDFDSSLISRGRVQWMIQQSEHLLHQMHAPENLQIPLSALELVSEADKANMWKWNAVVPPSENECVHDLVSAQALRQPDAPAICAEDGDFDYAALDRVSTALSHHLIERGVGPGSIVPLCFEKSKWMSVAMLAVMKTGAACVAMDATQPEERLRTIVSQVDPTNIVCSSGLKELAGRLADVKVIEVNQQRVDSLSPVQHKKLPAVSADDLLYVVFTSGSTGVPKGVTVAHRNFTSALKHQSGAMCHGPGERVYDFSSYSFDFAWANSFNTLCFGGCLCVPSEESRKNSIAASIVGLRANWTFITPSMSQVIDPKAVPCLQTVAFGGEAVRKEDVLTWSKHVKVLNIYGPAEVAQASSIHVMSDDASEIGTLLGLNAWVVDYHYDSRLAAFGGVGELWIEGPLVALGYLDDKEKTAASFVDDPPWLRAGGPGHPGRCGRLYRTGDLVRYNEDGTLAFVGRKDAQVKIRGQRVELAEVEHHILQCLAATDVGNWTLKVVAEVIKPRGGSTLTLVAFVSLEDSKDSTAVVATPVVEKMITLAVHPTDKTTAIEKLSVGLSDKLAKVVPPYMVPSVYIPIEKIPMTATGKTNRRQLRQSASKLDWEQLAGLNTSRINSRPPTTAMEKRLRTLWTNILDRDMTKMTVEDSFFSVGGDSVGAMRLVALARAQGLQFSVADVFRNPKLCDLARFIERCTSSENEIDDDDDDDAAYEPFAALIQHTKSSESIEEFLREVNSPALQPDHSSIRDVYPVTSFQQLSVLGALQTLPSYWNYVFIDLTAHVNIDAVRLACYRLVHAFEVLRSVFVQSQDTFLQVVLDPREAHVDVRQTDDVAKTAEHFCDADISHSGRLGHEFTHFAIIHDPAKDHARVVLRLSHAQYDGISLSRLTSTLGSLYCGEAPRKEPSFGRVVKLAQSRHEADVEYWKSVLTDFSVTLLPSQTSLNARELRSGRKLYQEATLPMPMTSSKTNYTCASAFTACAGIAWSHITQQPSAVFGRLVSGRNALPGADQDIFGPCINIVPVRIGDTHDTRIAAAAAAASVQQQLQDGMSHELLGFDAILQHCFARPQPGFGLITQYQNIEENPETRAKGTKFRLGFYQHDIAPPTGAVWVIGWPLETGVRVMVAVNGAFHGMEIVERVMGELRRVWERMVGEG